MDQKLQSSFIPKKTGGIGGTGSNTSLFSLIATLIFIITVLSSLGIFGYNYFLKTKIGKMDAELAAERKNIQSSLIDELARTDRRIKNSKTILNSHVSVSSVFDALQALTVRTIRFTSFKFKNTKDGSLSVELEGVGRSFNSLTLQSDVFREEKAFINPTFSDLELDENGNVVFSAKMGIDPSFILYKNTLVGIEPSHEIEDVPLIMPPPTATSTSATSSAPKAPR
jgi:hypothetical protein